MTGTGTVFSGAGTLNANTSTIKINDTSNTAVTFAGGGLTFNNVYFSRGASTGQINISGNNTFNDFKDDGTGTHTISWIASTVNVFTTFTVSGTAGHLITLLSATAGTRFVLIDTSGSNVRDYLSLMDCLVGGGATWTAGANSTFVSNNEGWSDQPATPSRYWVAGNGNWSSISNWATTSGGASGASVPTGDMNVFFDASSGSGWSVVDTATQTRNLDFSNFTGIFAGASASQVYGNITLASGMTNNYSGSLGFRASLSNKTITSNTNSFAGAINIGIGINSSFVIDKWTLQDNFNATSKTVSLNDGTFDANNFNFISGSFSSNNSNPRVLIMGSGTWSLGINSTGSVWNIPLTTNLTLTPNTSTIKFIDTGNNAQTFAGGGLTYNNLWFSRGASTASNTISGSNTFNDFKDDGTAAHSILFTAGITTTVTTFTVSGNGAGNEISINSTTTTTHSLVKSGAGTISSDYLNIQHSVASPATTWYAGTHSINNQATATAGSGWIFTAPPAAGNTSSMFLVM